MVNKTKIKIMQAYVQNSRLATTESRTYADRIKADIVCFQEPYTYTREEMRIIPSFAKFRAAHTKIIRQLMATILMNEDRDATYSSQKSNEHITVTVCQKREIKVVIINVYIP